jgi:hypothetical protein
MSVDEYEECLEMIQRHLNYFRAPPESACAITGPWGSCEPCVRIKGHRGMHFDLHGWWSDDQADDALKRIVQLIHDS